jgi:hypothetical protein
MSAIDLGDVSAPAGAPTRRARGRIARGRVSRGWIALALSGPLTLGAAAVPPRPRVHQLWTAEMAGEGGVALTEDVAFVARAASGRITMTAYDLATGAIRWARPLDARSGELMSISVADGMVQLGGPPAYAALPGGTMVYPAELTVLDAATGESRWLLTGRGGVNQAGPGRLLAYSNDEQPAQAVVDAATGRVLADAGAGWPMPASGTSGRVVLLRASATDPTRSVVSRIDPVDGRVTAIGTVESTEGVVCDGTGRFLVCQRPDRIVVTTLG